VIVVYSMCADDLAVAFRGLDADDAFATAALQTVFVEAGALAVAVFSDGHHGGGGVDDFDGNHLVITFERNTLNTARNTAQRAGILFFEPDGFAVVHAEDNFVFAAGQLHADQFVAFINIDGIDAACADVLVGRQNGLLDDAVFGGHQQIVHIVVEFADTDNGGQFFIRTHFNDVGQSPSARLAAAFRNVIGFEPVHAARLRKAEQIVVRGGRKDVLNEVLFLGIHSHHAFAAAALLTIGVDRHALDVTGIGKGDHARLIRNEVLNVNFALIDFELRTARFAVFGFDFGQIVFDNAVELFLVLEQIGQVGDQFLQLVVFGLNFFAFEAGQLVEAHIEDGFDLQLAEMETYNQFFLCFFARLGCADDLHHFIQVIKGDQQSFEDMGSRVRLIEIELRAAGDYLEAVFDEALEKFFEVHDARTAVVDRQHNRAEGAGQLRVLVDVVEHDFADRAAFELNDHADAELAGFVADVRDALEPFFTHQIGHFNNH